MSASTTGDSSPLERRSALSRSYLRVFLFQPPLGGTGVMGGHGRVGGYGVSPGRIVSGGFVGFVESADER